MTIQHHPSDEIILAHSNGSLPVALSLVVGMHVDGCDICRQNVRLAQTLGGLFLYSIPPTEMNTGLAGVLERLDDPVEEVTPHAQHSTFALDVPPSLRGQTIGPKRWLAPGIWISPIFKDRAGGTRAYLLRAATGKALPHHGHNGIELTQVLRGEFFDGTMRYGAGDFLEADGGHEHRPLVGPGQECICVIASEGIPRGLVGLLIRVFT